MTCGVDTDSRFSQARKATLINYSVRGGHGARYLCIFVIRYTCCRQIPMLHRDKPAGSLPGEGTKRRVENGAEG